MYIRTRDRLGQGQATWSALQTFKRPTARPTPIGYLGNFNEYIGKGESDCEDIQVVDQFDAGSAQLNDKQKERIKVIAIRFLRLIDRAVENIAKKREKVTDVNLDLYVEGQVDKKTDPQQYGRLDMERAHEVYQELSRQMSDLRLKMGKLRLIKWNTTYSYSRPGSTRPTRATDVEFHKQL